MYAMCRIIYSSNQKANLLFFSVYNREGSMPIMPGPDNPGQLRNPPAYPYVSYIDIHGGCE